MHDHIFCIMAIQFVDTDLRAQGLAFQQRVALYYEPVNNNVQLINYLCSFRKL
jgi:hypothetical protein